MKPLRILTLTLFSLIAAAPLTAQDRKVDSHGLDIHYRLIGQGRPLLILGGGPGDVADRYLSLCDLLAKNVQCVLVEQRGTGKSTPAVVDASTISVALTLDDFEAVRRQLGLKQWAVLGFSYGGYLASLYAHFYPDAVSELVLLGSMGLNWKGLQQFEDNVDCRLWASDRQLLEYWSDPGRMKADFQQAVTETIRAKMPGYFFDRKKSLSASQTLKATDFNFQMGDPLFTDILKRNLDLAEMKPAYPGKTLILHGRQDPSGESVPLALARYYPQSRQVFIDQCGHYAWLEQPEKVLAGVVEALSPALTTNTMGMEAVLIPPGSFLMGSPEGEGKADEHPRRRVFISKPFYLGKYPVTVAEFRQFVKESGYRTEGQNGQGAWVWSDRDQWEQKADAGWENPYFPQTDRHPVVCVSWNDAKAFCAWLSRKEGRVYRLPTEAEFEYACRAGTSTPWFFGPDPKDFAAFGWPQARTAQGFPTHPVGLKQPNPWGLYDLIGNAWQWCEDWYRDKYDAAGGKIDPRGAASGKSRVNRGGMGQNPLNWRSACRDALPPESDYSNQTFRVVLELIPDPPQLPSAPAQEGKNGK